MATLQSTTDVESQEEVLAKSAGCCSRSIAATAGCGMLWVIIAGVAGFFLGKHFCPHPPPPTPSPTPAAPTTDAKLTVTEFVPYFNYRGPLKVEGSGVIISNQGNPGPGTLGGQLLSFDLTGVDTACSGNPPDSPNACGIHIHEGMSCDEDALGHYWNRTLIIPDPWTHVTYTSIGDAATLDDVLVVTGLYGFEVNGHTMIVHDSTGARIACGIIEPSKLLVPAFGKYPNYSGSLNVQGTVEVTGKGSGAGAYQHVSWQLAGLPEECLSGPGNKPNSCGIHIHEGFNCENAQGHYYNTTEDPWKSVVYKGGSGHYGPIVTDTTMFDVLGRTFVVHDYQGARVACGIIQPQAEFVPSIGKYGTYDAALQVSGDVTITVAGGYGLVAAQRLSWNLTGVDPMCAEPVGADAPANACGIHIHEGPDCTDAGGHYYNPELNEDPWKQVTYKTVSGRSEGKDVVVVTGENMYDVNGRPFVVHDHLGARVGCGFISIQD